MASHDAAASFAIGMARHVPRCICHQGYATKNYFDLWLRMLAPSFELLSQYRKGGITFRQFAARHRSEMSRPEPRQVIDVVTMLSRHLSISIGCFCERDDCCHSSILKRLLAFADSALPRTFDPERRSNASPVFLPKRRSFRGNEHHGRRNQTGQSLCGRIFSLFSRAMVVNGIIQ
jgi:uncharacterized protein YeaO (DUF488 family)